MLALGFWQLSRAEEKIEWQVAADTASQLDPIPIAEAPLPLTSERRYIRVELTGRFESEQQFLWDNRIHKGLAGYEVVTPFRLVNGQLVLVNRGWVRADQRREVLPDVDFASTEVETMSGVLTQPSIGFSSGPAVDPAAQRWPKRMQHFAFAELNAALGEPVLAGVVQNLSSSARNSVPMYNDVWQPVSTGPERHYGYAFQWFAMFAALTLLFFYLNLERNRAD